MIALWFGICLLNCVFAGFDDYFQLSKLSDVIRSDLRTKNGSTFIDHFPEMNAQLKKQQIPFKQNMKNYLNSNITEKARNNDRSYDDCVRLKSRSTVINNDIEV